MQRAGAVIACACVLWPGPASAHPLGLPAFAQMTLTGPDTVSITWNAAPDDVAALARSLGVDVAPGGVLTRQQDAAFSRSLALTEVLRDKVTVAQDGELCRSEVVVTSIVARGASWEFTCGTPVGEVDVTIALLTDIDERYRTLTSATTPEGVHRFMFTSAASTQSIALQPGEARAPAAFQDAEPGGSGRQAFGGSLPFESQFVALIDRGAGLGGLALGVLVAFGVGALHGLAPGHGKAIAAAYLVGDRGRPRDALLLGGVVAGMHTWSVLALGFALYWAAQRPATELLSGWLQLVAGVVVAVLGAWLLWHRLHERQRPHDHGPTGSDARHPLSWPGLVGLGAAGGLLPSPSALLVLFTALTVGRLPYGLTLIAAFSLGLAVTVSVVGLAVLGGRDVLSRRWGSSAGWGRALRALPMVAAALVTALGLVVATTAGLAIAAAR